MHLFYTPELLLQPATGSFTLSEEESKHCIRVLRLTAGDKITLIDGQGGWYEAEITDDNPKRCSVRIVETKKEHGKRGHYLHIAIAPTKSMDRIEWFLEKATETGIDEVSLIDCKNTERTVVKAERLNKVAVSAIKQSLKAYLPKINEVLDFKKFLASTAQFKGQKFIAHCYSPLSASGGESLGVRLHLKDLYKKGEPVLVLIGPEGDFTVEEVKMALGNGFQAISLGSCRLRTETAALYVCTAVNVLNE